MEEEKKESVEHTPKKENTFNMGWVWLIIIVFLISNYYYQKSNSGYENKEPNKETITSTEYEIEDTLKNISKVYYNNEATGNVKYFGKRVKVTAEVDSVSVDQSVFFNTRCNASAKGKGCIL